MSKVIRSLLVGVLGLCVVMPGSRAEDKKPTEKPVPPQPALSLAAEAYHLALLAEQRKSPVLMLSAIELISELKESRGHLAAVKSETVGKGKAGMKPLSTDVKEWAALAREYAKSDKELSAFLDKRLEKLGTRGLIYVQGTALKSVDLKGTKFKVIQSNVLAADQYYRAGNVKFDAGKLAGVGLVVDPGTNLVLTVEDAATGLPVGKVERGAEGNQVCVWYPSSDKPHNIKVSNFGTTPARFIVLANWDN